MTYEENVRAILESNFAGFKEEVIDTACKMILGLRTYGEWIPVEERLPEENGRFLVFLPDRNGTFMCADFLSGKWYQDDYECTSDHVKAWMPLPKPYKEGDPDA